MREGDGSFYRASCEVGRFKTFGYATVVAPTTTGHYTASTEDNSRLVHCVVVYSGSITN